MQILYETSVPIALEARLFLHAVALVIREVERKNLIVIRNEVRSTSTGIAILFMQKAWDALTKLCSLTLLSVQIQPYLWSKYVVIRFQVLLQLSDGLASLKQEKPLFEAGHPCRDLMEWMPAQETVLRKSMKRINFCVILCSRT